MKYKFNYESDREIKINDMDDMISEIKLIKNKIDYNPRKWITIKKIIHDYEYIYTSPNSNKNIANIVPFSRSYFKLKEMINSYGLMKENNYCIFCIAEAPGGFIQCLLDYETKIDKIVGTSLLSDNDSNIPYWNKKLFSEKLEYTYGKKQNGDICDIDNLLSMVYNKQNTYDIITADGGFDYSIDYNKQEKDSLPLIHSEILLALCTQKKGGTFICKLFDMF